MAKIDFEVVEREPGRFYYLVPPRRPGPGDWREQAAAHGPFAHPGDAGAALLRKHPEAGAYWLVPYANRPVETEALRRAFASATLEG